jgi:hypothetical protein
LPGGQGKGNVSLEWRREIAKKAADSQYHTRSLQLHEA